MAYELMILVSDQSPLTMDKLEAKLRKKFSADVGLSIKKTDSETITIEWKNFKFQLSYEAPEWALEESSEIANEYAADREDKETIARCRKRIMLTGGDDPEMD